MNIANSALAVAIVLGLLENMLNASDPRYPRVDFDLPLAVACREIPTKTKESGKKYVEAEIPLSVRVGFPVDGLQSILVELVTIGRRPVIHDFMPKEKLVPETDGGVSITEREDGKVSYASIGLGVNSKNKNAKIQTEANENARALQRTYTLPAKSIVLATSGTSDRFSGIWFKLERTAQHKLEKQHKLYIIFEVDKKWCCDAVKFAAKGVSKENENCGENLFYLGLYLEGNENAKNRADKLGLNEKFKMIVESQKKIREIEGYVAYPYLGYGTMAEKERIVMRNLQKGMSDELEEMRKYDFHVK